MKKRKPRQLNAEPAIELEITLPSCSPSAHSSGIGPGDTLSLGTSLAAGDDLDRDLEQVLDNVIDILGSAVAESTGWKPPEAEDLER